MRKLISTPAYHSRISRIHTPVQGRRSAYCPHLNTAAIALALGISPGYLNNVLKGRRRLRAELAKTLAGILGVSVQQVHGLYIGREDVVGDPGSGLGRGRNSHAVTQVSVSVAA